MKTFILTIAVLLILAPGAIWLLAMPQRSADMAHAPVPASTLATRGPHATATVNHAIDAFAITPSVISAGSSQPVLVTATISDPTVIRSGINLLVIHPDGTSTVIGTLNDDGMNGDAVPNDQTFSLRLHFSGYAAGDITLRVSAAFKGSLIRTQSQNTTLTVQPALSSNSWQTLADQENTFSVRVPPEWNATIQQTYALSSDDGYAFKSVDFQLPNGTSLFTIHLFTRAMWNLLQQADTPSPVYLGESSTTVFGYGLSENNDSATRALIRQALATFAVK